MDDDLQKFEEIIKDFKISNSTRKKTKHLYVNAPNDKPEPKGMYAKMVAWAERRAVSQMRSWK